MTDHVCDVPATAPNGKWTCDCGERWFTAPLANSEHVCKPPDPWAGAFWTCPTCSLRWFASPTIVGTYGWRSVG